MGSERPPLIFGCLFQTLESSFKPRFIVSRSTTSVLLSAACCYGGRGKVMGWRGRAECEAGTRLRGKAHSVSKVHNVS